MSEVSVESYGIAFFKTLYNILEKEEYFDVVIFCKDGKTLGAHKVILCCGCPYFRLKFEHSSSMTKDEDASKDVIYMPETDAAIMKIILKFLYSGVISLASDTVQDLLMTADFVGLSRVVEACCDFLKKQFDAANILGIHNLAVQLSCQELTTASNRFRNSKFLAVIEGDEFVQMPLEGVVNYLSSSELYVESEQQVFEAGIKWILADPSTRMEHFTAVMESIRFPLLSQKFLDHFLSCSSEVPVKVLLRKHLADIAYPEGHQFTSIQKNIFTGSCTFRKKIKTLAYIVGGHIPNMWLSDITLNLITCYDPEKQSFTEKAAIMREARSGHCCAVVDTKLFVFGGEENCLMTATAESWELNDACCENLPPLQSPKVWAGACSVANLIYIFGGLAGDQTIEEKIEIFDSWTNTWQGSLCLPWNLDACYALGVVYWNGLIYIIGGINRFTQATDQCLTYNPVTETFEKIPRLQTARARFGISCIDKYVYVAGGLSKELKAPLKSVERYSIEKNQWEYVNSMNLPRTKFGMVALNRELFAIGGDWQVSNEILPLSVERFDPTTDTWTLLEGGTKCRQDFCAVVM